ncbi:MAG: hypothetical protein PHP34_01100, partial [Bacteroidales bacterium]|nr:hypothetical protein [Bacteroidales bacterium]
GKVVLYQLSYFRMINFGAKRERHPVESLPRSLSVKTEAGKVVLYQLSYFRIINFGAKRERHSALAAAKIIIFLKN